MKLIFFVLSAMILSCNSPSETTIQNNSNVIEQTIIEASYMILNVTDFKVKMKSLAGTDFSLVDVRTLGEVAGGTIENSIHLDFYHSNFSSKLEKLDKSKPLMLFCRSGNRSGKASKVAEGLGFTEIYDLEGGFTAWSAK